MGGKMRFGYTRREHVPRTIMDGTAAGPLSDGVILPVAVVPSQTCFVNLPLHLHGVEPPLVLQLVPLTSEGTSAGRSAAPAEAFVGWGGGASRQALEVPAALAEALSLRPSQHVRIRTVELPVASALWVQPESAADWELANRDAEALRSNVLMQLMAAAVGQRLPLWVRGTECLWLRVNRCEPAAAAVRLAAGTDLIVNPLTAESASSTSASNQHDGDSARKAPSQRPHTARRRRVRVCAAREQPSGGADVATATAFVVGVSAATLEWIGAASGQLLLLRRGGVEGRANDQRQQALRAGNGGRSTASVGSASGRGAGGGRGGNRDDGNSARQASVAPPGYALGQAAIVPQSAAPDGHVQLTLTLRRLLGCEPGTWLIVSTPDAASLPILSHVPTNVTFHMLEAPNQDSAHAHTVATAPARESLAQRLPSTAALPSAFGVWLNGVSGGRSSDSMQSNAHQLGVSLPQGAVLQLPGGIGPVQLIFGHDVEPSPAISIADEADGGTAGSGGTASGAVEGVVVESRGWHLYRLPSDWLANDAHACVLSTAKVWMPNGGGRRASVMLGSDAHLVPPDWETLLTRSATGSRDDQDAVPGLRVSSCPPPSGELARLHGSEDAAAPDASSTSLGGRQDELCEVRRHARGVLRTIARGASCGDLLGILITGPRGIGKTALADAVARELVMSGHMDAWARRAADCQRDDASGRAEPYLRPAPVWAARVPAATLLTPTQPTAKLMKLHDLLAKAARCAPAVLILDNLDQVFPADPVDAAARDLSQMHPPMAAAACELLAALANDPQRPPVVLIGVAVTADRLHEELRAPGFFDIHVPLAPPDRPARIATLQSLAKQLRIECPEQLCARTAKATEGFVAAELRALWERAALFAAARRLVDGDGRGSGMDSRDGSDCSLSLSAPDHGHGAMAHADGSSPESRCLVSLAEDPLCLDVDDVREALQHVTCAARGAGQRRGAASGGDCSAALDGTDETAVRSSGALRWDDIGGADEAKRVLIEAVILPRDHPELFRSLPLRLTSGALLYGHQGCGKTLLASTLAAEAQLPFISVKGPELLNKYIGASEAAVRDLFERAAACRPCVLFFDEFDAIAPRRGQDSTGVTDRVVNQLLCALDGVEALDGVFVLAASNRPELIDPALLRPGRLDRKLLCPMPDAAGRAAILRALLLKTNHAPPVLSTTAIAALVARCDGFTGADLQAMVHNAQLAAANEALQDAACSIGRDEPLPTEATRKLSRASASGPMAPCATGAGRRELSSRTIEGIASVADSRRSCAHPAAEASSLFAELEHCGRRGGGAFRDPDDACGLAAAQGPPCLQPSHLEMAFLQTKPSMPPMHFAEREAAYRLFDGRDQIHRGADREDVPGSPWGMALTR